MTEQLGQAPPIGARRPGGSRARGKAMTIGSVCKSLAQEFPDITISKIRYLEDQKLLTPRRTPGGYRLYSTEDVQRLRTILRLQRDEFLPLRVIRSELAGGAGRAGQSPAAEETEADIETRRRRRAGVSVKESGALFSLEEVIDETRAEAAMIAELEEFGVITGDRRGGTVFYDETDREIVRTAAQLARYGVGGRNLRAFRTSADREAALLQQILAPSLRSHNVERRREAIETLENLAAVTTHLKHLLLIRDLRRIAGP